MEALVILTILCIYMFNMKALVVVLDEHLAGFMEDKKVNKQLTNCAETRPVVYIDKTELVTAHSQQWLYKIMLPSIALTGRGADWIHFSRS